MIKIKDISDIIKIIKDQKILERNLIERIGIFGSSLISNNFNDIDILISEVNDYKRIINFQKELEQLTDKKIDIVIEKYANPIIFYRAKKDIVYVTGN